MITVHCALQQRVVNDATDQWRHRLSACVDREDGHFKTYLGLLGKLNLAIPPWLGAM